MALLSRVEPGLGSGRTVGFMRMLGARRQGLLLVKACAADCVADCAAEGSVLRGPRLAWVSLDFCSLLFATAPFCLAGREVH